MREGRQTFRLARWGRDEVIYDVMHAALNLTSLEGNIVGR